MKRNFSSNINFSRAPEWAEQSAPRGLLRRDVPSLLLICMPDKEQWLVATTEESDAIADPNSLDGRLLRGHCALLSLPYLSGN